MSNLNKDNPEVLEADLPVVIESPVVPVKFSNEQLYSQRLLNFILSRYLVDFSTDSDLTLTKLISLCYDCGFRNRSLMQDDDKHSKVSLFLAMHPDDDQRQYAQNLLQQHGADSILYDYFNMHEHGVTTVNILQKTVRECIKKLHDNGGDDLANFFRFLLQDLKSAYDKVPAEERTRRNMNSPDQFVVDVLRAAMSEDLGECYNRYLNGHSELKQDDLESFQAVLDTLVNMGEIGVLVRLLDRFGNPSSSSRRRFDVQKYVKSFYNEKLDFIVDKAITQRDSKILFILALEARDHSDNDVLDKILKNLLEIGDTQTLERLLYHKEYCDITQGDDWERKRTYRIDSNQKRIYNFILAHIENLMDSMAIVVFVLVNTDNADLGSRLLNVLQQKQSFYLIAEVRLESPIQGIRHAAQGTLDANVDQIDNLALQCVANYGLNKESRLKAIARLKQLGDKSRLQFIADGHGYSPYKDEDVIQAARDALSSFIS